MIKVAICEDEEIQGNQILDLTHRLLHGSGISFCADVFLSGEDLIKKLEESTVYDIMFLDIEMKKGMLNGIDVGVVLRQRFKHSHTLLIYISAHEIRAREVFYVDAVRFLSKPIGEEPFREALFYACHKIIEREKRICTFIDSTRKTIALPLTDILYFETCLHHRIHVVTQTDTYVFYNSLSRLEEKYASFNFLRIHQSYLINFEHIRAISYKEIIMGNGASLLISAPRRKAIRDQYLELNFRRGQRGF